MQSIAKFRMQTRCETKTIDNRRFAIWNWKLSPLRHGLILAHCVTCLFKQWQRNNIFCVALTKYFCFIFLVRTVFHVILLSLPEYHTKIKYLDFYDVTIPKISVIYSLSGIIAHWEVICTSQIEIIRIFYNTSLNLRLILKRVKIRTECMMILADYNQSGCCRWRAHRWGIKSADS